MSAPTLHRVAILAVLPVVLVLLVVFIPVRLLANMAGCVADTLDNWIDTVRAWAAYWARGGAA